MICDYFGTSTTPRGQEPLTAEKIKQAIGLIKDLQPLPTVMVSPRVGNISGFPLVVSPYIPLKREQVKFPKSKGKRIRKKWAAKDENCEYFEQVFIIDTEMINPFRMQFRLGI